MRLRELKKDIFCMQFLNIFQTLDRSSSKTEGLLQFSSKNDENLYSGNLISMLPQASRKTRGDERSFWPSSTVGDHSKGPKTWGSQTFCHKKSGNSWMYPYQRTPMGNPYISPIYTQLSLEKRLVEFRP